MINWDLCNVSWNWSTIWTAVAAIGTWVAVLVYGLTLRSLNKTLKNSLVQANSTVYSVMLDHIGSVESRKSRTDTIFNMTFEYDSASKKLQQSYRNVVVEFDRVALLASTDDLREKILNFLADPLYALMIEKSAGIVSVRQGRTSSQAKRPDYARHLEHLWNWGYENQKFKASWNEKWPNKKINLSEN